MVGEATATPSFSSLLAHLADQGEDEADANDGSPWAVANFTGQQGASAEAWILGNVEHVTLIEG